MESYRLNSRIVEGEKEFMIQTLNDIEQGVVKTSLFVDGEFLDADILPHSGEISEDQVLDLVKTAHREKKSELEYLLKCFNEIIEQGSPEIMHQLGIALYYKKLYSEAERLFRTVIKIRPDFHEAWFYLCRTYLAIRNYDGAAEAGNRAVELKPTYADYRNCLGEAYQGTGSCQRAVMEFEESIKRNVYYADAYFNLAITYLLNEVNREDYNLSGNVATRAIDMLTKAVLIYPYYKGQNYDNAVLSIKEGNPKKAYALLTEIRRDKEERQRCEKSSFFQRFLMYTDLVNQNSISDRIVFLKDEIEKNPGYVDLYYELAICYLHQSKFDWEQGVDYFRKALEINPKLKKALRARELGEDQFLKISDAVFDISEKNF